MLTRFPNNGGYGNVVKIRHDDGRVSWYAHLRELSAANGRVQREAVIGKSGGVPQYTGDPGAGKSTGAHLHFMVQAPGTRQTEWIRTLPGITWYSGDPNNPCINQKYLGDAVGPQIGGSNPPPAVCQTSLNSPSDGATFSNPSVSFSWNAASCATNGYLFRIKTTSEMDGSGAQAQDTTVSGTQRTETISSNWYNTDLYWSVKPANVPNAAWSSARRFRVNVAPPSNCAAPTLNSPADGTTFSAGTITFLWNDVACNHNGFTFRIKTVASMDSGGETVVDTGNGTTQRIETIATNWHNRDLYWSVKAANASSAAWATARRFRVSPPVILTRPTLSSPSNGASLPQSTDVTLTWNASSGATQYKVELWGGAYAQMTVCDWQSATSCRIGTMWPSTMSWRVRARNASGQESDWSDTWSFIIQQNIPVVSKPTLASPSNGANLPQSTDVTLTWNAASNAVQYTVEVWGGPISVNLSG